MNRTAIFKALKIAAAAVLAIVCANLLQLQYAVTAGIITVLSIQNTKRETLRTARNRGLAFLCACVLAGICYFIFGFGIVGFTVYLFAFAFLCLRAGWQEAIAMDSVLISHFLAEKSFAPSLILNESLLFLIGTGFGILVNLHLRKEEKEFELLARQVDEDIKALIHTMACKLRQENLPQGSTEQFQQLEEDITNAKECALRNWNNTLWKQSDYEMNYIRMRENQSRVLKSIDSSIRMIRTLPKQASQAAGFLQKVEEEYHRENDVSNLLEELGDLLQQMKKQELPLNREEFEARAVLFYMFRQLEEFLILKNQFVKKQRGEPSES